MNNPIIVSTKLNILGEVKGGIGGCTIRTSPRRSRKRAAYTQHFSPIVLVLISGSNRVSAVLGKGNLTILATVTDQLG